MLADYDVNNDGTVTVAELAAGAELLRRQTKKARLSALYHNERLPFVARARGADDKY